MQNRQSSLFQAIQSLKSVFAEVLESVWLTNSWLGIRHNSQKEWQMLSLWDKLNFQNILRNHRIQACMKLAAVFEGWTFFPEFSLQFDFWALLGTAGISWWWGRNPNSSSYQKSGDKLYLKIVASKERKPLSSITQRMHKSGEMLSAGERLKTRKIWSYP